MKNKLIYLTKQSLVRKIDTKWFKIVNLLLCIFIVCAFNIDSIINAFGGDFDKKTEIYIIDNTNAAYDLFNEQMNYSNNLMNMDNESSYIINRYDKNIEEGKEELKDDKDGKIILEFNNSDENVLDITMLSKEYINLSDAAILNSALNNTKQAMAIVKYNINPEELANIYKQVEVNRIFLDEEKTSVDENMEAIISTVFPIFILPFFMLSIILVQMIGAEVNDEKTTRGMEIIISNVSPKVHLTSKVIAGNLFVIIQSVLLFGFAGIAMFVRRYTGAANITNGVGGYISNITDSVMGSNIIDKLGYIIPVVVVLILLTFLAYSLAAGILASMSTNSEDFQQLQTPIMVVSLAGFYLSMLAGVFKGSLFIKLISYIPFISAILSPSLLVLGQITIIDTIISIGIMIILLWWLFKYGLKIYKVGILNYSSKDLWKKMFKALKEK